MLQPINYMLDVQNPIQTAMTGLTQGMQIGQFMQAKEQAEREAIQKQQMQEELSAFASKPNKTHDDYANIMARFPSLAEDFKRSYDVLDSGKQQATFKTTSRVYAALSGGQPSVAKSILETEALGYENAGDKATADQIRTLAAMAETDPDGLLTISGLTLASTTPSQFKDVLGALGENQTLPEEINLKKAQTEKTKAEIGKIEAETEQTKIESEWLPDEKQWNIENIKSQIGERSGRLQLDRDTLETNTQLKFEELGQSNIKLSPGAEKIVNDAVMDSAAALTQSQKLKGLADKFEKEGQSGGWWTSGWTGFRKATGLSNDDQTAMMREYDRLISSEVNKSLPPGPATDKDIEIARKGFPPATADSTTITAFLRGMSKMSEIDAIHKQMVAEWTSQNGQLGSSKRDIEVLGVRVPQGTPFPEFYQKNLGRMLKNQDKQSRSQQASTGQAIYFNISP
ncbi:MULTISPECIES: hypothetical protein [Acinetobacter]|uniref:hypothetical protein n=1 Tax=Acinetobacter TaxID=469 RepID=UPI00196AC2F2|nr:MULTISPECIES: hypothetical protein [Acinetobacter]WLF73482.1 hypothetical protein Q4617_05585 [Acinetobacter junii]